MAEDNNRKSNFTQINIPVMDDTRAKAYMEASGIEFKIESVLGSLGDKTIKERMAGMQSKEGFLYQSLNKQLSDLEILFKEVQDSKVLTLEEKNKFKNKIADVYGSPEYMPDFLLKDSEFMHNRLGDRKIPKLDSMCQIFANDEYSKELEQEFLKETGCKSIEEYAAKLIKNNSKDATLRDAGLEAMATLKLYAIKKCQEMGIELEKCSWYKIQTINVNQYIESERCLGEYANGTNEKGESDSININGETRLSDSFTVVLHELAHLDQFRKMNNTRLIDFNEEPEMLIMAKDRFLSSRLKDYYNNNYESISYEADAQRRAIVSAVLDGTYVDKDGRLTDIIRATFGDNVPTINSGVDAKQKLYELVKKETPYLETYDRVDEAGNVRNINEIFEEEFIKYYNEELAKGYQISVKNKYGDMLEEYHMDENGCHRKSMEELYDQLKTYLNARTFEYFNVADKRHYVNMYKQIILSRVNFEQNPNTAREDRDIMLAIIDREIDKMIDLDEKADNDYIRRIAEQKHAMNNNPEENFGRGR